MGALLLILITCVSLGLSIASAHKQSLANAHTVDRSGSDDSKSISSCKQGSCSLGIALVWMIAQTSQTLAYDLWINRGGYRNPGGVGHHVSYLRDRATDDPITVVNPECRVYGMAGLRVADASVMPSVPGANANFPTIMIAERVADFIGAARRSC